MSAFWPPEAFTSRVDLLRSSRTSADIGTSKTADALVAHAVPCSIQRAPTTPTEAAMLQAVQAQADTAIYFPDDQPAVLQLRSGDKIVDLDHARADGKTPIYRLVGDPDDSAGRGLVYVAYCRLGQN